VNLLPERQGSLRGTLLSRVIALGTVAPKASRHSIYRGDIKIKRFLNFEQRKWIRHYWHINREVNLAN